MIKHRRTCAVTLMVCAVFLSTLAQGEEMNESATSTLAVGSAADTRTETIGKRDGGGNMRIVPINEAEAIIEPFWDPGMNRSGSIASPWMPPRARVSNRAGARWG